jgi:hypothetical protein
MAVVPLETRRVCRVSSCRNVGHRRVVAWIGGREVVFYFCDAHNAEYRADEVRVFVPTERRG